MRKWNDDTYNIQALQGGNYSSVPYSRIRKYRSK
jgi:hypothetical protein